MRNAVNRVVRIYSLSHLPLTHTISINTENPLNRGTLTSVERIGTYTHKRGIREPAANHRLANAAKASCEDLQLVPITDTHLPFCIGNYRPLIL